MTEPRRGMFGVNGSGDTSGYGRLVPTTTADAGSPRPYGGYFDAVESGNLRQEHRDGKGSARKTEKGRGGLSRPT